MTVATYRTECVGKNKDHVISYPAGIRRCNNVRFWLYFGCDVAFPTLLLQPKTNVVTTLCFQRRFSDLVLTLQQPRDSDVAFLTKI